MSTLQSIAETLSFVVNHVGPCSALPVTAYDLETLPVVPPGLPIVAPPCSALMLIPASSVPLHRGSSAPLSIYGDIMSALHQTSGRDSNCCSHFPLQSSSLGDADTSVQLSGPQDYSSNDALITFAASFSQSEAHLCLLQKDMIHVGVTGRQNSFTFLLQVSLDERGP